MLIEPGDFPVITGPSGCGKSTLLRIMAGLEVPDEGRVRLDGRDITGRPGRVGLVFQESGLYPWLTVRGNIEFGLRVRGDPPAERDARVQELLHLVGMESSVDLYPAQISGGMAQRVALARALAPKPAVLLLDEPFAAIDAQLRNSLQQELVRIWSQTGTTMVLVTHSVDEAVYIGRRLLLMKKKPGSFTREVPVFLPHPRVRTGQEFVGLREEVLGWMREETERG